MCTMEFNMPFVNEKSKAVCHLQWFESGCQPDLELVGVFDLHGEAKYRQTIAPTCPRLDQIRDQIVQIVNFFPPCRCHASLINNVNTTVANVFQKMPRYKNDLLHRRFCDVIFIIKCSGAKVLERIMEV